MTHAAAPMVHRVHLSLKWNVHPRTVAEYVRDVVLAEDPDVVTTTEGKGRARAIRRRLGKGWKVTSRGEYIAVWKTATMARWKHWPTRYRQAPGLTWSNGPHAGTRHVAAMFVNLRHKATGHRLRLIVNHSTSHVQIGSRFRRLPSRVRPYRNGMAWLGAWVRGCARKHPAVTQEVVLDSNVDNHLEHWRTWLETQLGMPSIWHDSRPAAGTHGHRLIDTAHTNGRVVRQRRVRVRRPGRIDHVGIAWDVEV